MGDKASATPSFESDDDAFDTLLEGRSELWSRQKKGSDSTLVKVITKLTVKQGAEELTVDKVSKKDDDAGVPIHLWLQWLNKGDSKIITAEQWESMFQSCKTSLFSFAGEGIHRAAFGINLETNLF